MNDKLIDILNNAKYQKGFPPREDVRLIKEDLSSRGNLRSGAAVKIITLAYVDSASTVLEEFADVVLKNQSRLGLAAQDEIIGALREAFNLVIAEARGCAVSEFEIEKDKKMAMSMFAEKMAPTLDHLQRRVRLKELDLGGIMSPVQISGGQFGTLIIGPVNESALSATVHQIIHHGGTEAEIGKGIETLVQTIGHMDENRRTEQAQLYDLIKGLLHQIQLPQEKRSRSTIGAIWEKIIQVSQVSAEVTSVVNSLLPMISGLLS